VSGPSADALLEIQHRSYRPAREGIRASWPEEEALDRAGLASLLAQLRYGVLATVRADGRAHAAPVAFSYEDGAFWIASIEGLRRRNLRATPWASLVVAEGQDATSHRALTAEGHVRLHEGADFASVRRSLDERWQARHDRVPDWAAAFIELVPERVFSHGRERARG
jgi:nitroimidazol reductase NimA-like FMN-containing flavoprotein (pyridoxamine 5'-phosphate oxidase superfamily)